MPWISEEQKKAAKEVDLLTYLQENEPHELVKSKYGVDEYRTKTNGSLVISNGLWRWNRGGFGGRSALDYLIKVRGLDFVDAVETILGTGGAVASHGSVAPSAGSRSADTASALPVEGAEQMPLRAEFKLPETALLPANAVSYLQKRGISPEVINRCLVAGILYESRKYQNVIFVGRDENCRGRFACQRGIKDDFKADVAGSDKRYSFSLPAENPDSRELIVFESPIDLLSHATLQQRGGLGDVMDKALHSATVTDLVLDSHRLSLGGTSDVALIAYLERNPAIEQITLCLDADEAGQTAARKIAAKLATDSRFEHISVFNRPPQNGAKDYNEVLLRAISAEIEQKQNYKQSSRRNEAAI